MRLLDPNVAYLVDGRRLTRVLTPLLLATGIVAPAAAQFGPVGFDNFGHIGNQTPFDLRDIRTTGTLLTSSIDDGSFNRSLGFDFDYYGTTFNSVNISTNGFLSFSSSLSPIVSEPLPAATAPPNLIAGAWTDLDPSMGGAIFFETRGAAGDREFVVGFYDVGHHRDFNDPTTTPVTFEIILHEGSNNIELQYDLLQQEGDSIASTDQLSVGIQNADGSDGLQLAFLADNLTDTDVLVADDLGYRITTRTNLGNLSLGGGGIVGPRQNVDQGEVRWFRLDLQSDITAGDSRFLAVNTVGSRLELDAGGLIDTELGFYDAAGNRIADDDDGGLNRLAELNFGAAGPDGDLAAGAYFISASSFQTIFGATDFDVESTADETGAVQVNAIVGTEIGALANGTTNTAPEAIAAGEALFYRFELADGVHAAYGDSLVIDTSGTSLSASSLGDMDDAELGLYDDQGRLIANDDDDGPGFRDAALSFGDGGSDGDLPAGTYYLTASGFNTTFLDGFNVSVLATQTGSIELNLELDEVGTAIDGDFNGDGVVDSLDYLAFRSGVGTRFRGNNSDGAFTEFLVNFGNTAPLPLVNALAAPEPAAGVCLLLGLALAGAVRRRG